MSGYVKDECGSCHAPIIWTLTTNANKMPVDFEPSAEGTVALRPGWQGPISAVLGMTKRFGRNDLRTTHFATCPDAKTWRRKDRGAA